VKRHERRVDDERFGAERIGEDDAQPIAANRGMHDLAERLIVHDQPRAADARGWGTAAATLAAAAALATSTRFAAARHRCGGRRRRRTSRRSRRRGRQRDNGVAPSGNPILRFALRE